MMDLLKLIALDKDDLKVISAHLQDAILRVDEMTYVARDRRFAAIFRRFNWSDARDSSGRKTSYERRQCALRFEKVEHAQVKDLPLNGQGEGVFELLAIDFEAADDVAGFITLIFAGGGAIRLKVDCIEAELRDLGPVWKTQSKPEHPEGEHETEQVK
jgi:hypothetical protein